MYNEYQMLISTLLAIGFVLQVRLADLMVGSNDRDSRLVILARSALMLTYSILVAVYLQVDLFNTTGLFIWTIRTALILAIPLVEELRRSHRGEDPYHWLRDYIVSPLCEEIVFRGPQLGRLASSVSFSLAHLNRQLPFEQSIPQLIITFLFGLYAHYVMVTTGSVLTCIVLHALCNFCGPPVLTSPASILMQVLILIVILLSVYY